MGGSYKQCIECGKRALSIATRCPACGRELEGPVLREPGGGVRLGGLVSPRLSPQLVAGAIAAVAIVAAAAFGRSSPRTERPARTADPLATSSEVALAATPRLDSAGTAAEVLVARTWTHVRKARRVSGDLEAVLLPGDTVVADSLRSGWYRVALEGEVIGYVHRSTLIAPGSRARPASALE